MSSVDKVWLLSGHDLVLENIMLMIGHSSLESLDICRQVCMPWNEMITNKIWENPTRKWGTIIQRRIERSLRIQDFFPTDKQITRAKLLGNNFRIKILMVQI